MTDDLAAWLKSKLDERERQLAEDERVALAASLKIAAPGYLPIGPDVEEQMADEVVQHIARHDPARVLAEVERGRRDVAGKRAILTELDDRRTWRSTPPPTFIDFDLQARTLEHLAQEFEGQPGWQEVWKA